jgi:iron(III) transport system permease protein
MTLAPPEVQLLEPATPPRAPRRLGRPGARTVFVVVVVLLLLYLVFGPLIVLIGSSLQQGTGLPFSPGMTWTGANYAQVFGSLETYRILGTTLEFSLGALAFAFVFAFTFAWLIERTNLPLRNTAFVLLVAPSGMPLLIMAIAWSLLLNPTNGVINIFLKGTFGFTLNAYTIVGMIVVQGFGLVPITFLLIVASLRGMNESLEDAARASGANRATIMRKIVIPLLTPALLGALIYEFVNSVETVDVPLVLGLPGHKTVLSTQVYFSTHPALGLANYGLSSTYGLFLFVLALAPLIIYNRVIASSGRYATVTGRSRSNRVIDLGVWRWPALAGVLIYVTVSFILPFLALLWTSFQPYYSGVSWDAVHRSTTSGWVNVWHTGGVLQAIQNTLVLGVVVALGTMTLSVCLSWIMVRIRTRFTWLLDTTAFIPHAMPGVVIGLSVLILYLILPLPFYGTVWIIAIALGTQYVALGTRLSSGGIAQTHVSLEEAAAASGAPMRKVWRRVLVPLIRPTFANGSLLIFVVAVQNLTLPLILAAPGNTVLSTLIWSRWSYGLIPQAAVLSVAMTAITVTAAILLRVVGDQGAASRA